MTEYNMGEKFREYMKSQPPLSVLTLDDLYKALAEDDANARPQVRFQLYRHSVGTPVFEKNPSTVVYGVRLEVDLQDGSKWEVFLSLPGLERDVLIEDNDESQVERYIRELQDIYGEATIDYWVKSAQYHSVGLIRSEMEIAKERTQGECAICRSVANRSGSETTKVQSIRACHIVSRHVIFWKIVHTVSQKEGTNIFTDAGVSRIRAELKANKYHSDSRYIIGLCGEHDQMLQRALRQVVKESKLETGADEIDRAAGEIADSGQ